MLYFLQAKKRLAYKKIYNYIINQNFIDYIMTLTFLTDKRKNNNRFIVHYMFRLIYCPIAYLTSGNRVGL